MTTLARLSLGSLSTTLLVLLLFLVAGRVDLPFFWIYPNVAKRLRVGLVPVPLPVPDSGRLVAGHHPG